MENGIIALTLITTSGTKRPKIKINGKFDAVKIWSVEMEKR